MKHFITELGKIFLFVIEICRFTFKKPFFIKNISEQIIFVVFRSFTTVCISGVFFGAIFALQFHSLLEKYNALSFLGGLNTSATIREVGPLLISFLLAGKIGAFTAAELGTMKVTDQINAIICLGNNPVKLLIVPRFIAIILASVILLFLSIIVSLLGSMTICQISYEINFLQFFSSIPRFVNFWTLCCGLAKSFTYGFIVASVSCFYGFHARGGAKGVGQAVTLCAVYTNLLIVISNFVVSRFLELIWELFLK